MAAVAALSLSACGRNGSLELPPGPAPAALSGPPPGPIASDASTLPPPGATGGIQPAPAALSAPPPGAVASNASTLPPPRATTGIEPPPGALSAPPPGPVAADTSTALPTPQETIAKTGFDAHGNPAATPGQKKPFFLDWLLQ
jgi:outer membrane usher protein